MARPTLTTHRKFRRLARLLGGQAVARGTLELVWDCAYASGEARIGDALDVEEAAQWPGERGVCVQALVSCGFLDTDSDGTYTVHDLWDHAPDYVARRAVREQERRAKGTSISEIRRAAAQERWQAPDASDMQLTGHLHAASLKSDANEGTPARAPAPAPAPAPARAHITRSHPPAPTNGAGVVDVWDAWRTAAASVGLAVPLTPKGRDHTHLTTIAEAHLSPADVAQTLGLFVAAAQFETKRSLGMYAANVPQLVAWLRDHPGVPYGAKAPPARAAPPAAVREWVCPHTPHCGAYWACQRLQELAAAKAEAAREG